MWSEVQLVDLHKYLCGEARESSRIRVSRNPNPNVPSQYSNRTRNTIFICRELEFLMETQF